MQSHMHAHYTERKRKTGLEGRKVGRKEKKLFKTKNDSGKIASPSMNEIHLHAVPGCRQEGEINWQGQEGQASLQPVSAPNTWMESY